jgi:hypothetical protein
MNCEPISAARDVRRSNWGRAGAALGPAHQIMAMIAIDRNHFGKKHEMQIFCY